MELKEIDHLPTTIYSVHESCYRSYHILNKVLEMVERGDSKETIREVVQLLKSQKAVVFSSLPKL